MRHRKGQIRDIEDRRAQKLKYGPPAPHKSTPIETGIRNFKSWVALIPKLPVRDQDVSQNLRKMSPARPASQRGSASERTNGGLLPRPPKAKPGPGQRRKAQ